MYAFVDESGNTGPNLFDEKQPFFLTAALMTKCNFDVVYERAIKGIASDLSVDQLHANQLEWDQSDRAAARLLKVAKKSDARFFISRVEKTYLAATKLFDTLFDSGENEAVGWHIYNARPLRMVLMFRVAMIVDEKVARDFWNCLMDTNHERATANLVGVCHTLESRVDQLPDKRTKELVGDALRWAAANPDAIQFHSKGKLARYTHLPNFVAFSNLLEGVEKQSNKWNRPVKRITHDRQMQFERCLAHWHELASNASDEPIYLLGGEQHVFRNVPGSEFVVSASTDSAGIQFVDFVLWIVRRVAEKMPVSENCGRLYNYIARRAHVHDFTFEFVFERTEELLTDIFARPEPDAETMQKAEEFIEYQNTKRAETMSNAALIE